MPFLQTDHNLTIHYDDQGDGFPLVLVHGWAMEGGVWAFQRPLAASFRLITVDLRGHGRSTAPGDGYCLADFAADIVSLFNGLGLERAAIAGWSLGAQAALEAAPLLGDRLAALVLVGATPRFSAADGWPHGLPATECRGLGLRLRRSFDAALDGFFHSMFAEGELSEESVRLIGQEIAAPHRRPAATAAQAALVTLAESDQRHLLAKIRVPALVINGDRDAICPPEAGVHLADHLPLGRFLLFAGAGHAPFLSRPREFNSEVTRFLREVAGDD